MSYWLFRSIIAASSALLLFAVTSGVHVSHIPVRSGMILARIESEKSVYLVGEPIMVRLTLINRSGRELFVWPSAPYAMSTLEVFNATGKPLRSTGSEGEICPAGCGGHPYTIKLSPRKPVVVEYDDRYSHWALREWADVRRWGYNIRQTGDYTLIASPKVVAFGEGVPEFTTSPTDKSNKVHIRISP